MMTPNFIALLSSKFSTREKSRACMNQKRYSASGWLSKHFIRRRRRGGQSRRKTRWRRRQRTCTGWQRLPKEYAISKSSGFTAQRFQLTPLLERKNFAKIQVHHGEFAF